MKRAPEVRRVARWLRARLRDTEKAVKEAVREQRYGEAERREGIADAYHYMLENIDAVATEDDPPNYLPAKGRRR